MSALYVFSYIPLQEYNYLYLYLLSIFSIVFGILVITNKNPIVSVLFLICLFVCISSYLIMLGLKFIGITYLLVYIGAVSVLFLFILMLINIRISEIQTEKWNNLPLAIIFSIYLYVIFSNVFPNAKRVHLLDGTSLSKSSLDFLYKKNEIVMNKKSNFYLWESLENKVNYVSSAQWDTKIVDILHISSIGNILYTNYLLWFIITSIILLLAMIGSIIITIN